MLFWLNHFDGVLVQAFIELQIAANQKSPRTPAIFQKEGKYCVSGFQMKKSGKEKSRRKLRRKRTKM